MIEVTELSNAEISEMIERCDFAHLACCRNDRPYVVPIHYATGNGVIFVYTTEGKKTDIIDENPHICLQIEEVKDNQHWTSVVVEATAARLTNGKERDTAIELITKINPTLTPAVSVRWMDDWVRENREVVYRITPVITSGRRAVARGGTFIPLEEKIM